MIGAGRRRTTAKRVVWYVSLVPAVSGLAGGLLRRVRLLVACSAPLMRLLFPSTPGNPLPSISQKRFPCQHQPICRYPPRQACADGPCTVPGYAGIVCTNTRSSIASSPWLAPGPRIPSIPSPTMGSSAGSRVSGRWCDRGEPGREGTVWACARGVHRCRCRRRRAGAPGASRHPLPRRSRRPPRARTGGAAALPQSIREAATASQDMSARSTTARS